MLYLSRKNYLTPLKWHQTILARPDDTSSRPSASWVTSDIWLVPFNSRTAVVTEFIVKNSKELFF